MKTLQFLKWTEICWTSESGMAIDRIDSIAKIYIYIHTSIYIFQKGVLNFVLVVGTDAVVILLLYIFFTT